MLIESRTSSGPLFSSQPEQLEEIFIMKMNEIKKGMQVVTNDHPKTQVYNVEGTDGRFMVELVYMLKDGTKVRGGFLDISVLRKPTKRQLGGV
jgi:hypothetical protein